MWSVCARLVAMLAGGGELPLGAGSVLSLTVYRVSAQPLQSEIEFSLQAQGLDILRTASCFPERASLSCGRGEMRI